MGIHQQQTSPRERTEPDSDLVNTLMESELDTGQVHVIRNLLSQDFPLANFSEAEVHESRWLNRYLELVIGDLFPPPRSHLQGEWRSRLMRDERQNITSLDDGQRAEIRSFIMGTNSRATRAKDGWQQEELSKSVQESRVVDDDDGDSGGWFF